MRIDRAMTKLSDYMKAKKITQVEFAEMVGVSQPMVSLMMRGMVEPSPRVAIKIQNITRGAVPFESFYPPKDSVA